MKRLRQCKAEYIKDQIQTDGGDQKKFWKSIREIIPNTKNAHSRINLINETTNEDIPMGQVADYINNFFLEIGPKLAASLDSTWEYKGVIADENIKDIEATQEEIIDISKKININKSSGMAHIPTWILKRAFITKSDIVTNIVNSSFTAC